MATLAGEGHEILVAAVSALYTGKAVLQAAAVEVAEDGLSDFSAKIPETGLIPLFMNLLKLLEIILYTAVIVG